MFIAYDDDVVTTEHLFESLWSMLLTCTTIWGKWNELYFQNHGRSGAKWNRREDQNKI